MSVHYTVSTSKRETIDLLPLSLIGCAARDIMTIVRKQHQHVTRLEVIADSERDTQPPWRFKKIHILYRFTGRNLRAESIKRAIELSETKYCSIYATLRDTVDIQSAYEIILE
jgi:putative redox protein